MAAWVAAVADLAWRAGWVALPRERRQPAHDHNDYTAPSGRQPAPRIVDKSTSWIGSKRYTIRPPPAS